MKLVLLLVLLSVGNNSTFAHTTKIDSLHTALSKVTSDSERLTLMLNLIEELINVDLEQALQYTSQALNLSRQLGDRAQEALALRYTGLTLYDTDNERPSSLFYFEESERIAEALNLGKLQVHNLMSIANFHRYVSRDSVKVLYNFIKSAEISKEINFHWGTGRSYAKLASFYTKYNQIDLCEHYLELAAKHYVKHPDGLKTIAHYYNEVGDKLWDVNPIKSMELYFKSKEYKVIPNTMVSLAKAHSYIGDNEIAINYLEEAIPHFEKTEKRRRMLGVAIAQLAEVYVKKGEYEAAKQACDEGIELLIRSGKTDQRAMPVFYRLKGIIMEHEGNDEAALEYYIKSQKEAKRVKFAFARIKANLAIGNFYSTRNLSEGKIICRQVLKDAKKRKYTNIEIEACDCLYKIHKERESYVDALFYHERKILLNDSLSVMKVKHALDINRKIAETDKLIAERELQKELSAKELKNQNIIIGLLMISTLLGLLFIGFLTKNQQRIRRKNKEINDKTNELLQANENLERSNEELERFAHIASHDLKTPLYNIIRFTSLLERRLKKYQDTELQEYFSFIKDGGLRMKNLIEDVLEYSKLTNIENRNIAQEVDLSGLCSELSNSISNYLQERQAIVEISTPLPVMNSNYSLLFRLFKNLVENAIKYNESATPMVKIYCVNHTDTFSILIEDNGIGIEEEYFEKIWEMFSRLHIQSKYEGTGLGLASCKKIMDTLEGEISLSSKVDEGTIFELRFPKSHLSKKSEDIQYA